MEAGTGKNTPFDKDCQRIENGVITSNDPHSKRERRFPVVDEERRMVLAIVRFEPSGKNKTITWNDGEHKVNPHFDQPYSFFISELFEILDGKINRIEALATPVPYGMWTGWLAGRRGK